MCRLSEGLSVLKEERNEKNKNELHKENHIGRHVGTLKQNGYSQERRRQLLDEFINVNSSVSG